MGLTGANIQTFVGRRTGDTSTAGYQAVLDILQGVLDEIYNYHRWPWRRKRGELTTQAPYTTGTISGSAGSASITGSGTLWTGITGYANTDDPFFLIVGEEIHRIESISGDTALTLKSALHVAQSGATYAIYRPWVDVASDVAEVVGVLCYPYGALHDWPLSKLDEEFQIANTGTVPYAYGQVEDGTSKVMRIGIFPFMTERKHLTYHYYSLTPDISGGSTDLGCPDSFRSCVVAGVLAEWYRSYDDRGDRVQMNEAAFAQKLAGLKNAAKFHPGPYKRREWAPMRHPRTGFYITQEVEF